MANSDKLFTLPEVNEFLKHKDETIAMERVYDKAKKNKKDGHWYLRRINMVEEVFSNPLVVKTVKRWVRNNYPVSEIDKTTYAMVVLKKYELPEDLLHYVRNRIFRDGLIDTFLIKPPVTYMSHKNKVLGPNIAPTYVYKMYKKSNILGFDESDNRLLLAIEPGTTITEIKTFLDDFYEDFMKPNLESDRPIRKYATKSNNSVRDNKIIDKYVHGSYITEIAKEFDISLTNVKKTLGRHGVPIVQRKKTGK